MLSGCVAALAGPELNREKKMQMLKSVKKFLVSEDGPTAVEYAVMLALIIVVCLTAITSVGTTTNTTFEGVATAL
ncbi:Flp/Fap pilin component [Symmachiella macrocystis]|nr:Flp/Fap pilin component [Symmachiella macrocystis]